MTLWMARDNDSEKEVTLYRTKPKKVKHFDPTLGWYYDVDEINRTRFRLLVIKGNPLKLKKGELIKVKLERIK